MTVSGGHFAHVGEVILTRRNYYALIANAGDFVSNGQRWVAKAIDTDVSIRSRRLDDTNVIVSLPLTYLRGHAQLSYAATGHSAHGATVDVARVVAGVGQMTAPVCTFRSRTDAEETTFIWPETVVLAAEQTPQPGVARLPTVPTPFSPGCDPQHRRHHPARVAPQDPHHLVHA